MTVLEVLRSHSGPITLRHLSEETGLPRREVEAEIQRLRLEGTPVITGSDGARLSSDPAEIRACSNRLRSRALTQLQTASALNRAADEMPLTLFGDAA